MVVSYWISTSNHNKIREGPTTNALYLIEFLHQTTTWRSRSGISLVLYLIEFLHQTTTIAIAPASVHGCILLNFYIKPQRPPRNRQKNDVVSYWISTSNHNWKSSMVSSLLVVSYWISTSNHNNTTWPATTASVVSYWISTSNHNKVSRIRPFDWLYLIEFLHQTTTAGVAICSISVLYAVLSGREIECGTFVEVSLMCFFVFQRTKILFFRKIPTAAACPVLPVHSCPRSWECLHTVCLSQTEYS